MKKDIATLERELEEKKKELDELKAQAKEAKESEYVESIQKFIPLAERLHTILCKSNHTDQCAWGYESDWKGWTKNRYIKLAQALTERVGSVSEAENVLSHMEFINSIKYRLT